MDIENWSVFGPLIFFSFLVLLFLALLLAASHLTSIPSTLSA